MFKLNSKLESHLSISNGYWKILNTDWGCVYRVKNGFLCVRIMSDMSFAPVEGQRYNLGTIPLGNLGISESADVIVPATNGSGFLIVLSNGQVQFESSNATKWNYAFVTIPVD